MRTLTAHSLDPSGKDNVLIENASAWFRQQIGHKFPANETQWSKCHDQIVRIGVELLHSIKNFLGAIESDSEMEEMKIDLRQTIQGGIDRATIESIAAEVLAEQDRKDLSPGAFCERNLSDWNKILNIKSSSSDLRREARIVIESSVSNLPPPSPLTTQEIIAGLKISQGPYVGMLVRERNRLLGTGILSRDELLAKLADYLKKLQSPNSLAPTI
jgi:hypothetical protein